MRYSKPNNPKERRSKVKKMEKRCDGPRELHSNVGKLWELYGREPKAMAFELGKTVGRDVKKQ